MHRLILALLLLVTSHGAIGDPGVTDDAIIIGRTAGMTGSIASRIKPLTATALAYIDLVNKSGGVHGRRIEVVNIDDGNDPARSAANAQELINDRKVFALFAPSGTPQTQAVLDVARASRVPIIGTSSGAQSLRKPDSLLFHIKAGYRDEFEKMGEHLKTLGIQRVAVVFSDDPTGREGAEIAQAALARHGIKPKLVTGFKPGQAEAAVQRLGASNVQIAILAVLAAPGAEFYQSLVKLPAQARPQVFAWSIVAVESIYRQVGDGARGMVVSQVFPSPNSVGMRLIRDYLSLARDSGIDEVGYPGLEGYVSARILVDALRMSGRQLDRERLVQAIQRLKSHDIGGDYVDFSRNDRVGRRYVELTIVGPGGKFLK